MLFLLQEGRLLHARRACSRTQKSMFLSHLRPLHEWRGEQSQKNLNIFHLSIQPPVFFCWQPYRSRFGDFSHRQTQTFVYRKSLTEVCLGMRCRGDYSQQQRKCSATSVGRRPFVFSKHVPKGSVSSVPSVRDKTPKDLYEQPYSGKLTFSSSFHIFPSVSACWLIVGLRQLI